MIRVVPANEATWADIEAIIGRRGPAAVCWCQRYKLAPREAFSKFPAEERALRMRTQAACGNPSSKTTSGLVAYVDGEPAGWCAVEPRTAYPGLLRVYRIPWEGRAEDRQDDTVWAVTCIFVRAGFRRRGLSYELARAAVDFARRRGARALEGYPFLTRPGQRIMLDEIHVGTRQVFAAAGFREVNRPGVRRVVMRIDFDRIPLAAGSEQAPANRR